MKWIGICLLATLAVACGNKDEYQLRLNQMKEVEERWQANIPLTSDCIMLQVTNYMDSTGSMKERAEAHYLLAATYYDMHDRPLAVVHALQCVELCEDAGLTDLPTLAKACSMLARIFRVQHNPQEALFYARKGYDAAKKGGFLDAIYITDVATSYTQVEDTANAQNFYHEAFEAIRSEHSEAEYADIIAEMLTYYAETDCRKDAELCLDIINALPADRRPHNYDGGKAKYFEQYGPVDSAIVYYEHKLRSTHRPFARREAARSLMEIYYQLDNIEQASKYAREYVSANDSVMEALKLQQTRDAVSQYHYQRQSEAQARTYHQLAEARWQRTMTLGIFLISVLLLLLLFANYKRRTANELLRQAGIIQQQQLANENLAQMALSSKLQTTLPELVDRFQHAAAGLSPVGEDDWKQLYSALNHLHPGWGESLFAQWPDIKGDMLHIACLLKAGMKDADITRLIPQDRSTVYRKIRRCRERLGDLL